MLCSWRLLLSIHLTLASGLHLRYMAGNRPDLEAGIARLQRKKSLIDSSLRIATDTPSNTTRPSRLAEALVEASAMGLVSPALVQH